jgi:hypothetical protein
MSMSEDWLSEDEPSIGRENLKVAVRRQQEAIAAMIRQRQILRAARTKPTIRTGSPKETA